MKRVIPICLGLAALAACAPSVPDSAAGIGFGSYADYQAAREAELAGQPLVTGPVVSSETTGTVATGPRPVTVATGAPVDLNNPGISDEQEFNAVSGRETIESDAERIARQREARVVIEPQALPTRSGASGPNIVEYALATTNAVGQPVYSRVGASQSRSARNCARYNSPDRAQQAFLAGGGPSRDREGLDPDGDGFACSWNPEPFRAARGGAGRQGDAGAIATEALTAIGQ
ncbi:MAG: hypothetical protein AAGK37_08575 [Pseudomonadota bacterium]